MDLIYSLLFMLNEMSPYVLLGFLIAGVMHAFIPQRVFARHLSGSGWKSVVKSTLIGIPLPLCSCGVLPTAIAMRRNGASKAASTSFLVATPQTGVDSIAATWSLLGPAFAVVRPVAALFTALFGGLAVGRAEKSEKAEPAAADDCHGHCATGDHSHEEEAPRTGFFTKCRDALKYGFIDLVGSIGGWLVIGLVIAALITGYGSNMFLNLSLFFAYAALYPDEQVLLFMFLPIKMKYLALADAALYLYYFIVGGAATRVTIVLCLLNVFLFLGGDIINTIRRESRYWKTRYNFRKAMRK